MTLIFPCCPVNRECQVKKTPIYIKRYCNTSVRFEIFTTLENSALADLACFKNDKLDGFQTIFKRCSLKAL